MVGSVFCVVCGREVEGEHQLKEGLCLDCWTERHPVLEAPPVIDLVRCPSCGSQRGTGGWTSPPSTGPEDEGALREGIAAAVEGALTAAEDALVRSLDLDIRPEGHSAFSVVARAQVALLDQLVEGTASTRVRLKGEACPVCSRRAGSYYEAVVQFRGTRDRPATPRELEEARRLVEVEVARMASASPDVGITRTEELHGGLDFYITNQAAGAQLARALASRFGASTSTSTTAAGRKEGRDRVRVTHAVRLPALRRGDLVLLRGELLRVIAASSKQVAVTPAVGEGRQRHVARTDIGRLVLVGDADAPEEAVVVSVGEGELQVLDPETLRTVDVPFPEGFDPAGKETVRVVRAEGRLHLVD